MQPNIIERVWRQDKMVNVDVLNGFTFTDEEEAHRFIISGKNINTPISISGTITANFKNADGVLVPLTGTIEDGKAVVVLSRECYAVEGPFSLMIFADTVCIYAAIANVINSSGEVIAYPTASIPSVQEMIEDLHEIMDNWPADYTELQGDVSDLKSAFDNTIPLVGKPDVIETVVFPATTSVYKRSMCTYVGNDNITGNFIYIPFSSSATDPAYSLSNIGAWSKDIELEDGHRYELSVSGAGVYEAAGGGEPNVSVFVSAANVNTDYGVIAGYKLIGTPYSTTLNKHLNKVFVYDSATMGNVMLFLCLGHVKFTDYCISAILKDTTEDNRIITVGVGKDYESFTDAIKAIADDNNPKTIYVDDGIYDVFEEYGGASYMSSLDTSGLSWTDVSAIVPPNTRIIGVGEVILKWAPTDSEIIDQAHAFLFSPLNLRGSCDIENIKIECSNCRYGIHDETGGLAQFDGAVHKLKNVNVIYTGSTYGTKYAYGAGHNKNMKLSFVDCMFSAANGSVWSTHDWPAGQYEGSQITFDNCVFINTAQNLDGSVRFSSSDTVGRIDRVRFNNCRLRNISFSTEANRQYNQCYDVVLTGCNQVGTVYSDNIVAASRIGPKQINVNLSQNYIDGLLSTKADKVGSYPDLTAGTALQMLSKTTVENQAPYTFRQAGGGHPVGDRAYIDKVVGGTVAWNQLCNGASVTVLNGHKYVSKVGTTWALGASTGAAVTGLTSGSDMVFDLTAMFGSTIADYIYSLETATPGAGVAWFRKLFPADYYDYNPGELISVSGVSARETVGFNQWDEEVESGFINYTGINEDNNNYFRSKNYIPVIPNATYFYKCPKGYSDYARFRYYDANKQFVSQVGTSMYVDGTFTIPAGVHYMRFTTGEKVGIGVTYNHDICINLSDPSRNGEYEPYEKHSYPLDSTLILRGITKLDSANKLYYDGDEYLPDGTVTRRYGIVDLGTLTWNDNSNKCWITRVPDIKPLANNSDYASRQKGVISDRYTADTQFAVSGEAMTDKTWLRISNLLAIKDTAYENAASFKSAMSGVYLVYELATPTTETAEPYQHLQFNGSTEEFVTTGIVPVGHVTRYPDDLRAKLDGLPSDFSTLIAPVEKTYTATRAYTSGALFIVNNTLYKATAPIANGATITPGTNCTPTTLAAIIAALQ